jgi:importin subunit alpha-1
MCDLLQSMDNKIIQVALDGLENILKVGEIDKEASGSGRNLYAQYIEEAGGMVAIHNLQHHENLEIYKKCFYIMDSASRPIKDAWSSLTSGRVLPRRGRRGG